MQGKEAYEQLQEAWLIEMAELSAIRKAETKAVKHFISKREDIYRGAYGKRVAKFPRQCVFFGTTNDSEFGAVEEGTLKRDKICAMEIWVELYQGVPKLNVVKIESR